MTDEEYFAHPALSKSELVHFARSPAHYKAPRKPWTEGQKRKLDIGSALHCAVLQPDRYSLRYEVLPAEMTFQTKAGKAFRAEAEAENKTVLKWSDHQNIQGMADAIRHHPGAGQLVKAAGPVEEPVFWKDPKFGFEWKCKPDKVTANAIIVDLKTTDDARLSVFERTAWNLKYHWQAFIYLWGRSEATGITHSDFAFIVVERNMPHGVMVYFVPKGIIMQAAHEIDPLRRQYAKCLETDTWPCYPSAPVYLSLPPWAKLKPQDEDIDTTLFLEGGINGE